MPHGAARLQAIFDQARAAGGGVLIPYICAGDPDLETSAAIVAALAAAGAGAIEIGVPYGDPLADGPTIAAAAQRALANGTGVDDVLALAHRARETGAPPILAFTYLNPVVQYGFEHFANALARAGAVGAIVPDLPFEESESLRTAFHRHGLALPLLVAPTTPLDRAIAIAERSDGFVYLVSRLGVTSASRGPDVEWIAGRVAQMRPHTERPIAVGFGISSGEHVREVCRYADGAIVGSALIDAYAGLRGSDAATHAGTFFATLAAATLRGTARA